MKKKEKKEEEKEKEEKKKVKEKKKKKKKRKKKKRDKDKRKKRLILCYGNCLFLCICIFSCAVGNLIMYYGINILSNGSLGCSSIHSEVFCQ